MGLLNFLPWRTQAGTNLPVIVDDGENLTEDDPDIHHESSQKPLQCDFQRYSIRPQCYRVRSSLLTKAIHAHDDQFAWPTTINADLTRRKSNTSSLELTSDSGQTTPASACQSPLLQLENNSNFRSRSDCEIMDGTQNPAQADDSLPTITNTSPKKQVECSDTITTQPRKRAIVFVCSPTVPSVSRSRSGSDPEPRHISDPQSILVATNLIKPGPLPRKSAIKFACPCPLGNTKHANEAISSPQRSTASDFGSRSFSPLASQSVPRDTSIQKYLGLSEAASSHVFARETIVEDDWLRRDVEAHTSKLTINDTLRKENEIRRLASEAEEEDQVDEDNTHADCDISEDELELDDENDDEEELNIDKDAPDDGNETDNEAGFAKSDQSDADEHDFWSPGHQPSGLERSNYRAPTHKRTASISSIDSMHHLRGIATRRKGKSLEKIRPGTPDLPDSTDFVCGTLDEDRPLEEAYLSSKEARKTCRHALTPQDIDPSFPTSDVENEDSDDYSRASIKIVLNRVPGTNIEDLDDANHRGRNFVVLNRKPLPLHSSGRLYSPPPIRRLHSPPPPSKQRLRSPPPRKLFRNSPKHAKAPTLSRFSDQRRSLTLNSRPNFSACKSTGPKDPDSIFHTPNNLCFNDDHDYDNDSNNNIDRATAAVSGGTRGHVRGAIDIVKGLEQRRQRRKEKLSQQQKKRKIKDITERKPPPGQGAERMREIALFTNVRAGTHKPYILSA
ncbi:hypothetical protein K3495_g6215 [Podosphaera aphanis]|nr:hypothetical protein K3495_g6215 [Podosphaera aphanis]